MNPIFDQSIWKDLVMDFLDMACFLSEEEQDFIVGELERQETEADAIHVFPTFAVDGRLVVIADGFEPRECWWFSPKEKTISRHTLR